jgi:hypothetical protein
MNQDFLREAIQLSLEKTEAGEDGKKAADATWEFFDRHLKP